MVSHLLPMKAYLERTNVSNLRDCCAGLESKYRTLDEKRQHVRKKSSLKETKDFKATSISTLELTSN